MPLFSNVGQTDSVSFWVQTETTDDASLWTITNYEDIKDYICFNPTYSVTANGSTTEYYDTVKFIIKNGVSKRVSDIRLDLTLRPIGGTQASITEFNNIPLVLG